MLAYISLTLLLLQGLVSANPVGQPWNDDPAPDMQKIIDEYKGLTEPVTVDHILKNMDHLAELNKLIAAWLKTEGLDYLSGMVEKGSGDGKKGIQEAIDAINKEPEPLKKQDTMELGISTEYMTQSSDISYKARKGTHIVVKGTAAELQKQFVETRTKIMGLLQKAIDKEKSMPDKQFWYQLHQVMKTVMTQAFAQLDSDVAKITPETTKTKTLQALADFAEMMWKAVNVIRIPTKPPMIVDDEADLMG
ncbi:uncharacterized protein LOC128953296 [Oppia nitens]|uniref:uncharacterized protein LOC128953296 n=1 Tax=Oppia nitens TaxID=1686743 RepID=UPI0023D98271|nr:uncharacterized protein LOC128953296 [Oppia nitens]XP_054154755.1 uncharacterized protein LOC128953296 [Oppia nitens]XP_054154756.1 uncharacterized protein LOC128953296 [Oppia nitens]XP_054154757.1 uncharacterized protein LOC128953296 [Oppia nitens]